MYRNGTNHLGVWLVVTLVLVCAAMGQVSFDEGRAALPGGRSVELASLPLVSVDQELADYLQRARELAAEGDYSSASEIFQSLLQRRDSGFVASADDPNNFVALHDGVNDAIVEMGEEGLTVYRRLHDARAQSLFDLAMQEADAAILRQLVMQYRHTTVGPEAIESLAQHAFDRSRYAEAVHWWTMKLDAVSDPRERAMTLARVSVGQHLSGQLEAARETREKLSQLPEELSDAWPVEAVDAILARPVPQRTGPNARRDYPGVWNHPSGQGVSEDVTTPQVAMWKYTDPNGDSLVKVSPIRARRDGSYYYGQSQVSAQKILSKGVVYLALQEEGSQRHPLPGYVLPLVVGQEVIFRTGTAVVSCDLVTGEELWSTEFETEVTQSSNSYYGYYENNRNHTLDLQFTDSGHYALAGQGDTVVAVGPYLSDLTLYMGARSEGLASIISTTPSPRLTALSVREKGRPLWVTETRSISGLEPLVLVSPPTVADGRAYVVGVMNESYFLLAFDLETGQLLIKQRVARQPMTESDWSYGVDYAMSMMSYHASAPMVSRGRVYVATNGGVVACFDSTTGGPIWAHTYPTSYAEPGFVYRRLSQQWAQPNPMIVSDNRLYVAPSDSGDVLCLDAGTGKPVWSHPNSGQEHMTFLPGGVLLLSVPDAVLLDGATGRQLTRLGIEDVYGRPAVTESRIYLPGVGQIYEVDLTTRGYPMTPRPFESPESLFGNLLAAEGCIVAANTVGVTVFTNYPDAYAAQVDRLGSLEGKELFKGHYRAGVLAMGWGHYDKARQNFETCRELFRALEMDQDVLSDLNRKVFYLISAQACEAETLAAKQGILSEAQDEAEANLEKVHNQLQWLRWHIASDEIGRAVDLAQELSEDHGDLSVVDLRLDDPAQALSPLEDATPRIKLSRLIHEGILRRLIAKHGQSIYASYDAKAQSAYDRAYAQESSQGLRDVAQRWPNSVWAAPARLALAEMDYRQSQTLSDQTRRAEKLATTRAVLTELSQLTDSVMAGKAQLILAVLASRDGQTMLAAAAVEQAQQHFAAGKVDLRQVDIHFADIQGSAASVFAMLRGGDDSEETSTTSKAFTLPVRKHLDMPLSNGRLLMNAAGAAQIDGDQLLVTSESGTSLIDLTARDASEAIVWTVRSRATQGAFAADGARVILLKDDAIIAADRSTGEELWIYEPNGGLQAGAVNSVYAIALTNRGKVESIDLATGRKVASQSLDVTSPSLHVAGDALLIHEPQSNRLTCLDLTDRAAIRKTWKGETSLSFVPAGPDLLVLQVDDAISGVRLSDPTVAIWNRSVPLRASPRLLTSEGANAVLSYTGPSSSRLEVLDGTEGTSTWRVETRAYQGESTWASSGVLAGDRLYVLCRAQADTEAVGANDGTSMACFDLREGRCLWQCDVLPGKVDASTMFGPVVAGEYLLNANAGGTLHAVDAQTGLWEAEPVAESVGERFVVDGGVLVVPTEEGIMVYGSR